MFNRRWAAWTASMVPLKFDSMVFPRIMSAVVGVVMIAAGASSFVNLPPP
jgi:hypothetical protein